MNTRGYGRRRHACALALALAAASLSACARPAPAAQQTAAPDGRQLFAQACAKCHAPDGSGGLPTVANGPRPIDLRSAAWQGSRSDQEILSAIRDGRGAMPPFDGVLAPQDVTALGAYVRSLKQSE